MKNHKKINSLLLLLPLLMMIFIPLTAAANRSIPVNCPEYTHLDIGIILFDGSKSSIQELLSSKIYIKGKVIRSSELRDGEIVLYRMIITCCAADALPFGILVKLPAKINFYDEEWAGFEGTIQLLPFNEKLKTIEPLTNMIPTEKYYPYFTATKAAKINAPLKEYLYY